VQYFRAVGRFRQDFHAEGPGFESQVTLRMNGRWKRQGKQNVVQRMQCNPVGKLLYCYSQLILSGWDSLDCHR
jgi:hypothetical protein